MIKHILRHTVYLVPPIMLGVSFLTAFIPQFKYCYMLGDLMGYSVLANLVFVYHFIYEKKYCHFTQFSVIGLLLMSLVSLLNPITYYENYSIIYDTTITFVVVFLGVIYTAKNA